MNQPKMAFFSPILVGLLALSSWSILELSRPPAACGDEPFIPRRQSKPPGPPLSPAEAISRMEVPPGFTVELVASEPEIVNPVAMTFDERGRIWITESFQQSSVVVTDRITQIHEFRKFSY